MTAHLASIAVDAVIWLFITWVVVVAFGARIAALHRRRVRAVRLATRPQSPTVEPRTVTVLPQQRKAS